MPKLIRRNSNGSKEKDGEKATLLRLFPGGLSSKKSTKDNKAENVEAATPSLRAALVKELRKELEEYKVSVTDEHMRSPNFQKLAQAIIDMDGYIMKAALKLKISYARFSKLLKKYPKLRELIRDATEASLDLAETKLNDLILAGDRTAIIFKLKCKGRHRGWVEDNVPSFSDDKPISFQYDVVIPPGFKLVKEEKEEVKDNQLALESKVQESS